MQSLIEQVDSFREFALRQIDSGAENRTLDDLYEEWRLSNPLGQQLQDDLRAVKASLREMAAGESGRPFDEFDREFRQLNRLAKSPE